MAMAAAVHSRHWASFFKCPVANYLNEQQPIISTKVGPSTKSGVNRANNYFIINLSINLEGGDVIT